MNLVNRKNLALITTLALSSLAGCGSDPATGHDPEAAEKVAVDRFSEAAGTLQVRTPENGLPAPNAPVDFDKAPFITQGLGPQGEVVRYYNFDVQPTKPAPIYVIMREGEDKGVQGQLNIVGVVPGDPGYNDFWQIHKVKVPSDYVANELVSVEDIMAGGYAIEPTDIIANCPVVPDGSTAKLRGAGESAALQHGWYNGKVVTYFTFEEAALQAVSGSVPLSPIYVTFNVNPDPNDASSGPASGFEAEEGTEQTHNVTGSLPGDAGYSPLWLVNVYDNKDFSDVIDLASVTDGEKVTTLAQGVANVNCPVVEIQE